MMKLEGKTALVTGAAGGLGKEFAGRLLRAGAKVKTFGVTSVPLFLSRRKETYRRFAWLTSTRISDLRP